MSDELTKLFEDVRQLVRPILEADLRVCDDAVDAWKEKLTEALRDKLGVQQKLKSLADSSSYDAQWDLLAHPMITDVAVVPIVKGTRILQVSTVPFYFTNPATNQKHALGAFQIHVYVPAVGSSLLPTIRVYNLWYRVEGFRGHCQHPHIWEDGTQCLGNLETDIADLLSTGNLKAVVLLMLDFLQSVNMADQAGKYITSWPYLNPDDGSMVFPSIGAITVPRLPGKMVNRPKHWLAGCESEDAWYDWIETGKVCSEDQDEEESDYDDE